MLAALRNIRNLRLDIAVSSMFETLSCVLQLLILRLQSGNIRTPEETANTVRQQFETAMLSGASEKVKNSMSSTGIRDTASASILNTLLELGKKLRKRVAGSPAIPENEVRIAIEKEFEQLLQGGKLDDAINPLLGMHGQSC